MTVYPFEANLTRVIPGSDHRRERWRNGQGWTRQVAACGQGEAWDWRLSIAEIEQDAAFSVFPRVERELVLLHGNGLRLCFDDGQTVALSPPHQRFRFSGERSLRGELVDGPARAFNLMWRPDAVGAELMLQPLAGSMLLVADQHAHWAVHLIAGQAHFDAAAGLPALAAGDTALLHRALEPAHYRLEGVGELIAVKFGKPAQA